MARIDGSPCLRSYGPPPENLEAIDYKSPKIYSPADPEILAMQQYAKFKISHVRNDEVRKILDDIDNCFTTDNYIGIAEVFTARQELLDFRRNHIQVLLPLDLGPWDVQRIERKTQELKLTIDQNMISFDGQLKETGMMIRNLNLHLKDQPGRLVILYQWNSGFSLENDKGIRIKINGQNLWNREQLNLISKGHLLSRGQRFYEIPLDLKDIHSVQLDMPAAINLRVKVHFFMIQNPTYIDRDGPPLLCPIEDAKKIVRERLPLNQSFLQATHPIYQKVDNGLVVNYEDSKPNGITAEGQAYAGMILSEHAKPEDQIVFDQLINGAKSVLPRCATTLISVETPTNHTSCTNADVWNLVNLVQAADNQNSKKWTKSLVDYKKMSQQLNQEILTKSVIYIKDLAIPLTGISDRVDGTSPYMVQTEEDVVLQYNPSFSYSFAANSLKKLDPKWTAIKNTQLKINNQILDELGLVDWCVVKINKQTGKIVVSTDLDTYFPKRYEGQKTAPTIEWPRLIMDHCLNYIRNHDEGSKQFLDSFREKFSIDFELFPYAGYRNELVIGLALLFQLATGITSYDIVDFIKMIGTAPDYYGNPNYKAAKHTMQQLLLTRMVMAVHEEAHKPSTAK